MIFCIQFIYQFRYEKDRRTYITKRKSALEKLDSIFSTIFYQVQPFSVKTEDFARSLIGNSSLMTPVITYDRLSDKHGVSSIDFSDKIVLDMCEIMNGLYDEQTNLLSVLDPTTQIEGSALFFKNHLIQNTLDQEYLEAVLKVGMLYGLFERDSSRAEKGIVEVVQIDQKGYFDIVY